MPSRGELEQRVMELLWAATEPLSVAEVQALLQPERELAYTTVMTVLDRLAKKGLTTRERMDRAWRYQAATSQTAVVAADLTQCLEGVPSDVRAEALHQVLAALPQPERTKILAASPGSAS